MKTKVYICKLDDSIALARRCELFDNNNLYIVTKAFRISNRRKPYIVDYVLLKESFKLNYVYIGEF
jgi:hypothetical protein